MAEVQKPKTKMQKYRAKSKSLVFGLSFLFFTFDF